jgi:hypothetical protein
MCFVQVITIKYGILCKNKRMLWFCAKQAPTSGVRCYILHHWRTPYLDHKIYKISSLNLPNLLIFGESKEKTLIYILTKAIHFPL